MNSRSQLIWSAYVAGITIVAIFCVCSLLAQASGQQSETKRFDIAADPAFKNYKQVVTRFAAKHGLGPENHFCIVGLVTDHTKNAWVLWKEGKEIILWEGQNDLDLSRRVIHLPSDVVPTESDLHSSTYLVTESWVDQLTKACESSGVKMNTGQVNKSQKP
jgi:hypothetical protein